MEFNLSNVLIVMTVLVSISLLYLIVSIVQYLKNKNQIYKYGINVSTVTELDRDLLVNKINDIFEDYMILNYQYIENLVITESEEPKITKEITLKVIESLSESMIHKISLFYNVDNLADIVAEKVYIMVMAYSVQKRTTFGKSMENKRAE